MGAYLGVIKSIMDFLKKIPSLVSVIVSIVFNALSEVGDFIY